LQKIIYSYNFDNETGKYEEMLLCVKIYLFIVSA